MVIESELDALDIKINSKPHHPDDSLGLMYFWIEPCFNYGSFFNSFIFGVPHIKYKEFIGINDKGFRIYFIDRYEKFLIEVLVHGFSHESIHRVLFWRNGEGTCYMFDNLFKDDANILDYLFRKKKLSLNGMPTNISFRRRGKCKL